VRNLFFQTASLTLALIDTLGVIPNPVASFANGGEGSAFPKGISYFFPITACLRCALNSSGNRQPASEPIAVDASKYVRRDKLSPQVAPHSTSAVGFTFINAKANAAFASIRASMAR
jgi:hypothetical protein